MVAYVQRANITQPIDGDVNQDSEKNVLFSAKKASPPNIFDGLILIGVVEFQKYTKIVAESPFPPEPERADL